MELLLNDGWKFKKMPVRLVNEEKGSYHLTDDVFDFLYRSKEIESELDYSVTRFKMQEYMTAWSITTSKPGSSHESYSFCKSLKFTFE